jgi:hypothetical protein
MEGDIEHLQEFMDKDRLNIEIKPYKEKRSLDANRYYWGLVGQIAKRITPPLSVDRVHNLLLGRYGEVDHIEGEPVVLKANIPPDIMLERSDLHCKVARGGDDNTWFYLVLKGSSEMNVIEFSRLLDGTIEEAKELGIDTATRSERDALIEAWGKEYEKRTHK